MEDNIPINKDEEINILVIFYDGWGQGKNLCEALKKYKAHNGHTSQQIAKAVANGQARVYVTNAITGGQFLHYSAVATFVPPEGKWAISLGSESCEAFATVR